MITFTVIRRVCLQLRVLPARGAVHEGQGSWQLGHSPAEDAAGAAHCRLAAAGHRLPDGLRAVRAPGPDRATGLCAVSRDGSAADGAVAGQRVRPRRPPAVGGAEGEDHLRLRPHPQDGLHEEGEYKYKMPVLTCERQRLKQAAPLTCRLCFANSR